MRWLIPAGAFIMGALLLAPFTSDPPLLYAPFEAAFFLLVISVLVWLVKRWGEHGWTFRRTLTSWWVAGITVVFLTLAAIGQTGQS